jgi:putative ATPase
MEDVVGQLHLLGPDGVLFKMTAHGKLPSIIFWGAPGTGKTTLARTLALANKHDFLEFSGSSGSVSEFKKAICNHREGTLFRSKPPVIFLDEIHRFNKTQQDVLLAPLERGEILLLGATTENPAFCLTQALRSRCQILELTPLHPKEIQIVLERTWLKERPNRPIVSKLIIWLSNWANGDLRAAINGLEILLMLPNQDINSLKEVLGNRVSYNKTNGHYELASAFQKSLRASDPKSSLYYLSRMIRLGEDPQFIARRLLVCAAEDIGNADPQAFLLVEAISRSVRHLGWPEARIPLAQAALYVG